jgi:hypothetical protein
MGKVLHASYSGYFPFCTQQGTPSSSKEYLSLSLLEAMTLFWRVKKWEVKVTGVLNYTYPPSGDSYRFLQSLTYPSDSFFECETRGTNITTEEDFVCVQDADDFIFGSFAPTREFQFGPDEEGGPLPPPIVTNFLQFFIFKFTTLDELIITDGSNFYVNFISFVPGTARLGTKDLDNFPEATKIQGNYSISFGGFTKNGDLYGEADGVAAPRFPTTSGSVSLQIRAKEYWSYGGEYDTTTGALR